MHAGNSWESGWLLMSADRAAHVFSPMAMDVASGLTSHPKTLSPKYFYDAVGSVLFD